MMLLGEPIDAATAVAWGLIDELVAPGTALQQATELATRLAAGPAQAIAACKSCIDAAAGPAGEAFALSRTLAVELAFSADLREGLAAFRERRLPVFTGAPVDPGRHQAPPPVNCFQQAKRLPRTG